MYNFRFSETYFKVKALQTFKISSDCHIRSHKNISCKRKAIKIASTVF